MSTHKYLDLDGLQYFYTKLKQYIADYYDGNIQAQVNAKLDEMLEDGTLQTLADAYFADIDLQEEVDTKLDEMAEDGTLARLIGEYIDSKIKIWTPKLTIGGSLQVLEISEGEHTKIAIVDFGNYSASYYNGLTYKLLQKGYDHFDYAFITHYHNDHVGSLLYLLDDIRFDFSDCHFYLPPTPDWSAFTGDNYMETNESTIIAKLESENIAYTKATNETTFDILNATVNFYNANVDDFTTYYDILYDGKTEYNNFSMCIQFTHKGKRLLFTGDIAHEGQRVIMDQGLQVPQFITIPHHGNAGIRVDTDITGSLYNDFAKKIFKPELAIASGLGDNDINFLWKSLAKIYPTYWTDENGTVEVTVGETITAVAENGNSLGTNVTTAQFLASMYADGYLDLDVVYSARRMPDETDLNNMTTGGTYSCPSAESASTLSNIPDGLHNGFKLIVNTLTPSGKCVQVILPFAQSLFYYTRVGGENNEWSIWSCVALDGIGHKIKNTDANDLAIGSYYCSSSQDASTIMHIPTEIATGFIITVKPSIQGNRLIQQIEVNRGIPYFYRRTYTSSGWGDWYKFGGEQVSEREPE